MQFPVGEGYAIHVYILAAQLPVTDLRISSAKHAATMVIDDEIRVAVVAMLQPWTVGGQLLADARARDNESAPPNYLPPDQPIDKESPKCPPHCSRQPCRRAAIRDRRRRFLGGQSLPVDCQRAIGLANQAAVSGGSRTNP